MAERAEVHAVGEQVRGGEQARSDAAGGMMLLIKEHGVRAEKGDPNLA